MKFKKNELSLKWNNKKLSCKINALKELEKNKLFFQCPNCVEGIVSNFEKLIGILEN